MRRWTRSLLEKGGAWSGGSLLVCNSLLEGGREEGIMFMHSF